MVKKRLKSLTIFILGVKRMIRNVLLVNIPLSWVDRSLDKVVIPIGLIYLVSYLEHNDRNLKDDS